MAEIINTLYGRPVGGWPAPSAYGSVTCNGAVNKVALNTVAAPWNYTFGMELNANPLTFAFKFAELDKFRILSYGWMLPHGLAWSNEGGDVPAVQLIEGNSNPTGAVFFLDQVSYLSVPWGDYECALDIFVDWSTAPAGENWYSLETRLQAGSVSMVGLAAALNGAVLYPIPYVKILHNIPLST